MNKVKDTLQVIFIPSVSTGLHDTCTLTGKGVSFKKKKKIVKN